MHFVGTILVALERRLLQPGCLTVVQELNLFSIGTVINTMRAIALILLTLLTGVCLGQATSPIFLKVRTDVTVAVRIHSTGADMVEVTMRDPNYPVDLLRQQMETLGKLVGTPPRGLSVGKQAVAGDTGNQFSFITATFATDGIILPGGILRIEPILKAFAGAPPPYTIQGLTIEFEGITPTKNTVAHYAKPDVVVGEGRYTNSGVLKGIEYRIALKTQDPNLIIFPDRYEQEKPVVKVPPPVPHEGSKLWLILSFVGLGIIGGALVYFALLRTGARAHS
ncbi:MAG TPA: hypothetical protein VGL56_15550 [Fimbriimonadaceae bacterium]